MERLLVLGADGYLGFAAAQYFAARGFTIAMADGLLKRHWEAQLGVESLFPVAGFAERHQALERRYGRRISFYVGDLRDPEFVTALFRSFRPTVVLHLAEQPSAPFSMLGRREAVLTQTNNLLGTLNLIFALAAAPEVHLLKLGSMGEYGTPDLEIEEGFFEVEYHGRRARLPYPRDPSSFYHLSKVHDSQNLSLAARVYGLRVTDINQGIVFGTSLEPDGPPELALSYHYDAVFGTVLNRFLAQAAFDKPLLIYGQGRQRRAFIALRETLRAMEMALERPPERGEYRVINQFTQVFSLVELAELVQVAAADLGLKSRVISLRNPRREAGEHYYNPSRATLESWGLPGHQVKAEDLRPLITELLPFRSRLKPEHLRPRIRWSQW